MKYNWKISLPFYKISYSFLFTLLLSLVRGISNVEEIGVAMDANIALLSVVFCADTYYQEFQGNRWEVFVLLPSSRKFITLCQRLIIQFLYLTAITMVSYWFFYWQIPFMVTEVSPVTQYVLAVFAIFASIVFFGALSFTCVNLLKNIWAGIGAAAIIWLFLNSTWGSNIPEWIAVFAYGSKARGLYAVPGPWVLGKLSAIVFGIILIFCNKKLLGQKREKVK